MKNNLSLLTSHFSRFTSYEGDRKDFYQAELDLEKIIKGELINIARSRMKIALDTVLNSIFSGK